MWTENYPGWFLSFGYPVPYRPVEDLAFAVARFFEKGGTFQNYYMPVNRSSQKVNIREKGFRIVTEPSTVSAVLQWAHDDEVRKMTYIKSNFVPRANLGVLDNLIAARHEISQIMGYKSYADYALHSNMASLPDVVSSFLDELSKTVYQKAVEEFESICNFKREKNGQQGLDPWDEAYFTRSMKSSAYNLDFSVVASYFSLTQCIEGLKILVESLFGMKFLNCPLAPGESWHPDVIKMALHHPDEGDLGYIYLDLNSRQGKYPGCAHFAIRGGRKVSNTEYQLPVIALVCNFSKPHNSSIVRLNHSDVDTLFHEFGHALHSLLSRTPYAALKAREYLDKHAIHETMVKVSAYLLGEYSHLLVKYDVMKT